MSELHSLLKRQIKKYVNASSLEDIPAPWREFVAAVNEAYAQSDQDRVLLERSMELSSQEMLQHSAVIRERERRMSALLENVQLLAVGLDNQGRVEYVNPFLLRVTGYEKKDFLGQSWFQKFVVQDHPVSTEKAFREMISSESFKQYQNVVLTKDSQERTVVWYNTLLRDENGQVIGTLSLGEDVTYKNFLIEQLIESEKESTLAQLAAGVAHEVKNPLAIMLQGLDYFVNEMGPKDNQIITTILDDMRHAVLRADLIIKSLLDLSKPTQLSVKPWDIHLILDNSLLLVKNNLDKHQIKVVRKYQANPSILNLDKEKMIQVFINLFNNAAESMVQTGTLTIETTETVVDSTHQLVIKIEDNGPGIPIDVLSHIFDPFFTTKRGRGGTGLGLSIVKNIVNLHQGRIEVQNRKEGGARVTLTFNLPH